MVSNLPATDGLWRLLWFHVAGQIIEQLPHRSEWELIKIGYGYGLRSKIHPRQALLLHPSSEGRATGDLALTVAGRGTQVIPRHGHNYPAYIALVEDAVATVAHSYLGQV